MRAHEFVFEAKDPRVDDPKIIDDVKHAYDMGLKTDDISSIVGIPYTLVVRILSTHYPERTSKPRPKRYSDDANAIIAAWDRGLKPKQIAIELGIPREKVVATLQDRYPDRSGKRELGINNKPEDLNTFEQEAALRDWRKGVSIASISKKYGMHPNVTASWIKNSVGDDEYRKRKESTGYQKNILSQDDIRNIIDLYTSGKSIGDIAKSYNTTYNTVKYHLMKQGNVATSTDDHGGVAQADIDKMVKLKKAGSSVSQISKELGIGDNTVRWYLRGRV